MCANLWGLVGRPQDRPWSKSPWGWSLLCPSKPLPALCSLVLAHQEPHSTVDIPGRSPPATWKALLVVLSSHVDTEVTGRRAPRDQTQHPASSSDSPTAPHTPRPHRALPRRSCPGGSGGTPTLPEPRSAPRPVVPQAPPPGQSREGLGGQHSAWPLWHRGHPSSRLQVCIPVPGRCREAWSHCGHSIKGADRWLAVWAPASDLSVCRACCHPPRGVFLPLRSPGSVGTKLTVGERMGRGVMGVGQAA